MPMARRAPVFRQGASYATECFWKAPELPVDEFERHLMRCSTNAVARRVGAILPRLGQRQRRNAQDWIKAAF